jgi:mannose-1-phosphate guanylyltransferase/phosphomannomutase
MEMKGGIMRKMSEQSGKGSNFIDGIKVHFNNDWVLVLPDQYQPLFILLPKQRIRKLHKIIANI